MRFGHSGLMSRQRIGQPNCNLWNDKRITKLIRFPALNPSIIYYMLCIQLFSANTGSAGIFTSRPLHINLMILRIRAHLVQSNAQIPSIMFIRSNNPHNSRGNRPQRNVETPNERNFLSYSMCSYSEIIYNMVFECEPVVYLKTGMETFSSVAQDRNNVTVYHQYGLPVLHDVTRQWKVPLNTTDLRLWEQGISIVAATPFYKLSNLVYLYLQRNEISYLSKQTFVGLRKLRELDLSFNRLQTLTSCLFVGLENLITLRLNNNEIEAIRSGSLLHLVSLTSLDLSNNLITEITDGSFRALRSTHNIVLNIRNNLMTSPRGGWFRQDGCSSCECTSMQSSHNASKQRMVILRAAFNPWDCSCRNAVHIFHFLNNSVFFTDGNQSKWDINMPCATPDTMFGINIASPVDVAFGLYKLCCMNRSDDLMESSCQLGAAWLKTNVTAGSTSYDSQVTIIGIGIVIAFPILLMFCPDCDKTIRPYEEPSQQTNNTGGANNVFATSSNNNRNNSSNNIDKQKPHARYDMEIRIARIQIAEERLKFIYLLNSSEATKATATSVK